MPEPVKERAKARAKVKAVMEEKGREQVKQEEI